MHVYRDLSLYQDRLACGAGLDKLWLHSYDVASQELVSQSAPQRESQTEPERAKLSQRESE